MSARPDAIPKTLNADELRISAALRPWGWTCTNEFWRTYYSDAWVFNLTNALTRLSEKWDKANDYLAARERNDGAESCDWSACAAEVDRTWHNLRSAAGYEENETPLSSSRERTD